MNRSTRLMTSCAIVLLTGMAAFPTYASPADDEAPATLPGSSQSQRGLMPASSDGLIVCSDPSDGTCDGGAKQDEPGEKKTTTPSDHEKSDDRVG